MPRRTDNTWLERIAGYLKNFAGVKSGSADNNGDVMKIGGEYNATPYTYVDGSRVAAQVDQNGNLKVTQATATAVVTSVNDTASSTTLIAANTSAKERIIQNDSTAILYIKHGTTASSTDYTVKLGPDDIWITEYAGRIDGIWSSDASGAAKITEHS